MEKYAKKAKIALPDVRSGFRLDKWKKLMISATIIYATAFFSPWIWEHYNFLIWTEHEPWFYPSPLPKEGLFWSFWVIVQTTRNNYGFSLFWNYWFNTSLIPYHTGFSGWLGIFILQISTITTAVLTIKKKSVKKRLSTAITAVTSMIAPILCIYQFFMQTPNSSIKSWPFIGFWLATISSILFFASYRFARK